MRGASESEKKITGSPAQALSLAAVHGDAYLERPDGSYAVAGPDRLAQARAIARVRYQLDLARTLDAEGVYGEIAECGACYEALFTRRRKKFLSKARNVRSDVKRARRFGSYVDASSEPPDGAPSPGGDPAAGAPWVVHVFECVPKYVCWAVEVGGAGRRTRDYVLHEPDLDVAVARRFPRSEALSAKKNGDLADAVHGALALAVDGDLRGRGRGADEKRGAADGALRLVLPDARDFRESEAARRIEAFAATRIQRGYKGFDARALFKRLLFQLRQKDVQSARLAARRARAHLDRLALHASAALLQAPKQAASGGTPRAQPGVESPAAPRGGGNSQM